MATCAECGSSNKDGRTHCDVCNALLPTTPVAPAYQGPVSRPSRVPVVIGVVVVVVLFVGGVALLVRPSGTSSTATVFDPAPPGSTPRSSLAGASPTTRPRTTLPRATTIPGWSTFSAIDGSFRVQIPSAATSYDPVAPSPGVRGLRVAATGNDRFGYIIEYGELAGPLGEGGLRDVAVGMAAAVGKRLDPTDAEPLEVDGLPGIRFRWENDGAPWAAAVFTDDTRVYLLLAGAASADQLDFDRFVASFRRSGSLSGGAAATP